MFYRPGFSIQSLLRSHSSGHVLPLVLGLLAMGSLAIAPFLSQISLTTRGFSTMRSLSFESYSSSSGIEHARWRLQFESGFADSINQSSPTYTYNYSINNASANITINRVSPLPPPAPTAPPGRPQSERAAINYAIVPSSITAGETAVVTITITITNLDTSNIKFKQIGDLLPPGFTYISGTASGVTSAEPVLQMVGGKQQLTWDWGPPQPGIPQGQSVQQIFQASALASEGFYYNDIWVWFVEDSIGIIYSPYLYPVVVEYKKYDVMSEAGHVTIKSRMGKNNLQVIPLSWQR